MANLPGDEENKPKKPLIGDKVYDLLKKTVQLYIPALATFYVSLAAIYGLSGAQQVTSTAVAVCAFLGVFLKVSDRSYKKSEAGYDGSVTLNDTGEELPEVIFGLKEHPNLMEGKDSITLKVLKDDPR